MCHRSINCRKIFLIMPLPFILLTVCVNIIKIMYFGCKKRFTDCLHQLRLQSKAFLWKVVYIHNKISLRFFKRNKLLVFSP